MSASEKMLTRKNCRRLRVPVLPDEEKSIIENASRVGLPTAVFLRRLGLGHEVKSVLDHQKILDLARINADLGRLGGLLKLWLTNDERLKNVSSQKISQLLDAIKKTQDKLFDVVQSL